MMMLSFCKLIPQVQKRFLLKYITTVTAKRTKFSGECLTNRSVFKINGKESKEFLQGIITNDIEQLTNDISLIYSMFLNVQGRVLFDAFISKSDSESYIIECDSQIVDSLINHLKLYKVRRKLNFEKLDSFRVWALFNDDVDLSIIEDDDFHNWYFNPKLESTTFKKIQDIPKESKLFRDPRLAYLGHRIILPVNTSLENYFDISIAKTGLFTKFRYKLGVEEGAEDLPRGKYLPLEANCDYLHGVSFQKGCYIGQELTARTYHTGVIRRRFMPIVLDSETSVEQDAAIVNENGKSVGKYINSVGKYGIASFRINDALKASSLKVGSITVKVEKPRWWPSEGVSRQSD